MALEEMWGVGVTQEMLDGVYDFYINYDIYTGYFDLFSQGNQWLVMAQSWPCLQSDGTQVWGDLLRPGTTVFNAEKECFSDSWGLLQNSLLRTSNSSGIPDSIRIEVYPRQEAYRFGVPVSENFDGAYFNNISLAI